MRVLYRPLAGHAAFLHRRLPGVGLTERQLGILRCFSEATLEMGFPPSLREIGDRVGLSSCSTVYRHMSSLVEAKMLKPADHKPRAYVLTDKGAAALGKPGQTCCPTCCGSGRVPA